MKDMFANIGWFVIFVASLIPLINLDRHISQRLSAPLSSWDIIVSILYICVIAGVNGYFLAGIGRDEG